MKEEKKIFKSLLIRCGLTEAASDLYIFIENNPGCSIAGACRFLNYSKSSIYRACEELMKLNLINSKTDKWRNSLEVVSLGGLIKKIENEKRKKAGLINSLKEIELRNQLSSPIALSNFETLNEEETFERYLDLSKSRDWDTMLALGNWEDFNTENRCIVSLEKKFIENRLKKGGNALVAIAKHGPNTSQIVDYNKSLDRDEYRKSIQINDSISKPYWINAFEGNNYVHIWDLNSRGRIVSTFLNCRPVAEFYKNFIHSKLV